MGKNVEQAKEALYGPNGLRVTDVKLFQGSSRDATTEEVAGQIAAVVEELKDSSSIKFLEEEEED